MGWYKEITKEEAKERYCRCKEVYLSNRERGYWKMPGMYEYSSHAPAEELFYRSIPNGEGETKFFMPLLTQEQKRHQYKLNAKHGWGMNKRILMGLYRKHLAAYKTGNEVAMAEVEYRLSDANFHSIAGKLRSGDYQQAIEEIQHIT